MERLGRNLKKVHAKSKNLKIELKKVISIGLQLVDRLELLHSQGLVHKDLKPANVCFGLGNSEDPSSDNSKILYLIDYGLTQKVSEKKK